MERTIKISDEIYDTLGKLKSEYKLSSYNDALTYYILRAQIYTMLGNRLLRLFEEPDQEAFINKINLDLFNDNEDDILFGIGDLIVELRAMGKLTDFIKSGDRNGKSNS